MGLLQDWRIGVVIIDQRTIFDTTKFLKPRRLGCELHSWKKTEDTYLAGDIEGMIMSRNE